MSITQSAGDAEAHHVSSPLKDEHVSVAGWQTFPRRPGVSLRTVSVTCSPSAMEMTSDSIIYTNILVYAPVPSARGVTRQEKTSVPVECVYRRRFSVDSVSLVPAWLPHLSVHSAEHALHFTLHLMTTDWLAVREGVYFLGDVINMEASVFAPRLELQVFVQDCVATATSEENLGPRYQFIQNGCFTDGQQTSSTSRFLPRMQSDKLRLQLHSFIFRQVHSAQIFISCSLKADFQSSSSSRACSYIQGSWGSADRDDSVCESCQTSDQFEQNVTESRNRMQAGSLQMQPGEPELRTSESEWADPGHTDAHALQQTVQVGPLTISPWSSEVSPPAVLEGVHISYVPSIKTKRLTALMLQGNTLRPGASDSSVSEETVGLERGIPTEPDLGVALATPTPEPRLTVTPPVFTSPETFSTRFETDFTSLSAAVTPETPGDVAPALVFVSDLDHNVVRKPTSHLI
ncbi:zona pellucida sperm-binding protein 3-like [Clarias magur]|uniref:Zona pellucida sperm-binding protein 3 n=1 Tax=Clarias magur TaxID=1594786 RepID=A0A8J4U1H2_CLAMG|nr:zona pellucida sperm-binding protein 3-like [Clarias magur]